MRYTHTYIRDISYGGRNIPLHMPQPIMPFPGIVYLVFQELKQQQRLPVVWSDLGCGSVICVIWTNVGVHLVYICQPSRPPLCDKKNHLNVTAEMNIEGHIHGRWFIPVSRIPGHIIVETKHRHLAELYCVWSIHAVTVKPCPCSI